MNNIYPVFYLLHSPASLFKMRSFLDAGDESEVKDGCHHFLRGTAAL